MHDDFQHDLFLSHSAKNKHDGCDVENELALAIINLAPRGLKADFGPGNAETFRRAELAALN